MTEKEKYENEFQNRVIVEKKELDEKCEEQMKFLHNNRSLNYRDLRLLEKQYKVMLEYSDILATRIYYFGK